jgi:hypothetical protein
MSLLDALLPLWLILFCGTIIAAVFNLGTVAICLLTGVKYTRIAIFYGKPVITIPTRFGPVVFGYLPFGGYKLGVDQKRAIVESIFERVEIGEGKIKITYSGLPSSEELCKNQQQMAPVTC